MLIISGRCRPTHEDIHVLSKEGERGCSSVIYHCFCDHMKTSNPAEAEDPHPVKQATRCSKSKTAKNRNDGLDDVPVRPFELVTLHK